MAVKTQQIAMNASTATQIIVPDTSNPPATGKFYNVQGNSTNPLPTLIKNIDSTNTVYIGNSGVTTSNGFPLAPGEALPIEWLGTDAQTLYGIASASTPIIAVIAGNQ